MRTLRSIVLIGMATLPLSNAQVDPDAYLTDTDVYLPFTAVSWNNNPTLVPGIDPPISAPAASALPSANPGTTRIAVPSAARPSVIPPSTAAPSAAAPTTQPASAAVASATPSVAAPDGDINSSPQGVVGIAVQSTSEPAAAGQDPSAATTITAVVVVVTSGTATGSSMPSGAVLNGASATSELGSGISSPSATGATDDNSAGNGASASATVATDGTDPSETAAGKAAKSKLNIGVIVGAVVGAVVGVALVLCALCLILRRRRRRPKAIGRAVDFTLDDDWDPLMYSDKDKPDSPVDSPVRSQRRTAGPHSPMSASSGYTTPWEVSVWESSNTGSSSSGSPISPFSPMTLPFSSLRRDKSGASPRRTTPRPPRQSLFPRLFQPRRFHQEEDGGSMPYSRIGSGPSDDVELIPPTYDPAWSESRLATPTTGDPAWSESRLATPTTGPLGAWSRLNVSPP